LDAGVEYTNQFLGFSQQRADLFRFPDQGNALNEEQPAAAFTEFLEADAQFVDKIGGRFRRLGFAMIGQG